MPTPKDLEQLLAKKLNKPTISRYSSRPKSPLRKVGRERGGGNNYKVHNNPVALSNDAIYNNVVSKNQHLHEKGLKGGQQII